MAIGWVDFSKEDRDKVLSVINLLQEEGAVDELGIGVIRDAFSNYFFPGTSTVQTRAKYFLFAAYELHEAALGIYGCESVNTVIRTIDSIEKQCGIDMLKDSPADDSGIIGRRNLASGKWVARKPYEIYWNGLCTYNIFKNDQWSFREYIGYTVMQNKKRQATVKLGNRMDEHEDGTEDDEDALDSETIQFVTMPTSWDKNWRKHPKIQLTREEATFLRKQIETTVPKTLLAIILKNNIPIDNIASFKELADYIKPILDNSGDIGKQISKTLELACEFNDFVYMSRVRYNMLLSDGNNKTAIDEWEECKKNRAYMARVRLNEIDSLFHIRDRRLMFFLKNLQTAFITNDNNAADYLIAHREESIKGPARAKIRHKADYPDNIWVGGGRLDYRFNPMKRILSDIFEGEKNV